MRLLGLLLFVGSFGCGHSVERAGRLGDSQLTGLGRSLLEAYVGADADKVAGLVADDFVSFDADLVQERRELLDVLRWRREHRRRGLVAGYREQRVWIGEGTGVYAGHLIEQSALGDTTAARDGWYTLVFAPGKMGWKAVSMQWVVNAGADDERHWNEVYRESRPVNPEPNRWLTEIAGTLTPGTALDVGVGQGRNAVYLASKGWRVTGVDVTEVGLQQTRDAALARHLTVDLVHADESRWDWGRERWDLIALIYMGCDEWAVSQVRRALKPGGVFVTERYHVDSSARLGTTPEALAQLFDRGFDILRNETVEDVADWSDHPERRFKLVRFAARKR